ncbi:MAG TPA: LamG-like jellyroll fold domain-containing protein, partial [Verrucomicrobiae bacterium]|nr:LamG-like jellyroll fold domain-containing protein [Verrucomicrobiae bacterium]
FVLGGPMTETNVMETGVNQGTLVITYDFFYQPNTMHVYYDGVKIFDSGAVTGSGTFTVDYGPGVSTSVEIIMNEGGNPSQIEWDYTVTSITRGIDYAIFSEDTNVAQVPIKFAIPPYGTNLSSTSFMSSDFETVAAGDYNAPATVDGWSVLTNKVTVVNDPTLANTGHNSLALRNGRIARTLPTQAGGIYELSYAFRRAPPMEGLIAWWPAEENYVDIIGGNDGTPQAGVSFGPGEVNQAFSFDGSSRIFVPNAPSLNFGPTSPMSIEFWAYRTGSQLRAHFIGKRVACDVTEFNYQVAWDEIAGLQINVSTPNGQNTDGAFTGVQMPMNVWTYLAATFDGNTFRFYINGALMATGSGVMGPTNAEPLTIGDSGTCAPFQGLIDEMAMFNRALTPAEIQEIYAVGHLGKCGLLKPPEVCMPAANVLLGGFGTNTLTGTQDWQTNHILFTAQQNGTPLEIDSTNGPSGMMFDSFVLSGELSGNNYFLPEDSLAKLAGERLQGNWLLEVLDDRAGPLTHTNPTIVSWQLSLNVDTINPFAIPLSHAIPNTNTINPFELRYYEVDVPAWASVATNILAASGSVDLLFNQNVLPGTNASDILLLGPTLGGTAILRTNTGIPPLLPAQRYYLAVTNLTASTVNFTIEVDFNITTLTNGVALTNTLGTGGLPRYYQYDVSTNGVAALFELFDLNGNADLVVSRGPPLPDLATHDYISDNLGTNNEDILVVTNSKPVPLAAGRWYLGVFNQDVNPVTYAIRATEFPPPAIITLTNGIPFLYHAAPGLVPTNFFRFVINQTNAAALFELYSLSGNVDLELQRGSLPYAQPFFAGSFNPGTNSEQIVIRTNLLGTNINDNWFLAVPDQDPTNVNYTIRAVVSTNGLLISGIPIKLTLFQTSYGETNVLTLNWPSVLGETYEVESSTNLVNWSVVTTITNSPGPLSTYAFPSNITINSAPWMFFRVIQLPSP